MFSTIIINICISILIIIGLQYFWNYLKDNFTKKLTKDLVNTQLDKYKKIITEIEEIKKSSQISIFDSSEEKEKLNDELSEYMNSVTEKTQLNTVVNI